MATLLPALLAKYDALTASGFAGAARPPAYHDTAPQVTAAGAQLRVPYTLFSTAAEANDLTFESDGIEDTRVTVRSWATNEDHLDSFVAAFCRNGQATSANAGFDNGTLPTLTDGVLLSMIRTRTPVKTLDGIDRDGKNVYRVDLEYLVSVQRS